MINIQGRPLRMKLLRLLNQIFTVVGLLLIVIHCNCKLVSFLDKSSRKSLEDYAQSGRLYWMVDCSYFISFTSSLQSRPMWVALYISCTSRVKLKNSGSI